MEVDSPGGCVVTTVKTGSKRTHSGELASSPQQPPAPPDSPGSMLALIGQVFRVSFTVSTFKTRTS